MKLTFINDEYSQDLRACAEFARRAGLDAMEVRSVWGTQIVDQTPERRREAASILKDHGLAVPVVDSFVFKGTFSPQGVQEGLELARRAAEVAALLEGRWIRIFGFWREGGPSPSELADAVGKVAEIAAAAKVGVLLENGTWTTVAQGSELARLVRAIGRDDVRSLWDPANVKNGQWPEEPAVGIQALGPTIAHVHVKNVHGTGDGRHYDALRGGGVDWPDQLRVLRELGYGGYLSLETHARRHRNMGRDQLDFPGGYDFSAGGEEATERLVAELRELVAEARA